MPRERISSLSAARDWLMSWRKSPSARMRESMQATNSKVMSQGTSTGSRAEKNKAITSVAAISALIVARAMAARMSRERRHRMCSWASRAGRAGGSGSAREAPISRARSMARPRRLVIVSRSSATPEIRMTGPMAVCSVGIRSTTGSTSLRREDGRRCESGRRAGGLWGLGPTDRLLVPHPAVLILVLDLDRRVFQIDLPEETQGVHFDLDDLGLRRPGRNHEVGRQDMVFAVERPGVRMVSGQDVCNGLELVFDGVDIEIGRRRLQED